MRYVVDIDGTICNPGDSDETRYTGATPIQDRIDKINRLYDDDHHIVYLTARGMGRFNNSGMHAHKRGEGLAECGCGCVGCPDVGPGGAGGSG